MKKTHILLLIITVVLISAGYLAFHLYSIRKEAKVSSSILPDLDIKDLKGDSLKLASLIDPDKKTLLLYFDSKCGKCRDMLGELGKLKEDLHKINFFLLSAEELDELKNLQTRLSDLDVRLVQVEPRQFFRRFGSLKTPQVFTYSKDKKQLPGFHSQTTLEQVFSTLKK